MLFFSEHRQKLYVSKNDWDETETVYQVLTHSHVAGEHYDTEYTHEAMRVLAAHEEMKEIDKEIAVEDVSYRLDLSGMRIKHRAQAAKSTASSSGKAQKGILSWQTFKKFETIGDLAYAWFELGGMLWKKMPAYKHAASPAASETVEGEVLPPVKVKADAVAIIEPDAFAVRVGQLHQAAQQYANASVLCAAIAGAVMHQKKKSVKHGEFSNWLEALADEVGISRSTCYNYMAIADEMAARLKALPKGKRVSFLGAELEEGATKRPILQLLADLNPADLGGEKAAAVADAVRDVTNGQTLRQLYFDWGIMKDRSANAVRTGGDMEVQAWLKEHYPKLAGTKLAALPASIRAEFIAYRESRKPTEAETIAGKREFARRFWERQRVLLTDVGTGDIPTWGLLPDQDLLQTMVLLENTAKQMKRVLNERGAR